MRQYQKSKSLSSVGANLKAIRGDLSQAAFAALLGIEKQVTYHRYEAGRVPKAHILQDFSSRFGITLDELLAPISSARANEIRAHIKNPKTATKAAGALSLETRISIGQALSELVNQTSVTAVTSAWRLCESDPRELMDLGDHLVEAQKRAPLHLQKYYHVLRFAVQAELSKRMDTPFDIERTIVF